MLKDRLTHNLSHSISQYDASVNKRIDHDAYPELIYGWCLLRIIHFICAMRLARPNVKILITKYNYSDAYQRICHSAKAALETILVIGAIAFIMLRLSFGGSPNPSAWTCFSEMVTDLSNELPLVDEWDPKLVHSPAQQEVPEPVYFDKDTTLEKAKPMAVSIPTTAGGRTDCFIDDIVKCFYALDDVI